jgi:hypothetical protein
MRVNLILPKNNKSRRYQKRINEDSLKESRLGLPLAKIVQAKKGYTQWIRNFFWRGIIIERWKRIEEDRCFNPFSELYKHKNSWSIIRT